jgi:SNF2 family DNA or RNA helicase
MRLGSLLRSYPSTSLMDQRDTSNPWHDIVIMPYSLLSTPEDTPIHRHVWDRVILDEAHEIRNKSSRLFKSVCRLNTDIRWIVTGTPVFNSMNDFVSLCAFLGIEKCLVQAMTNKIQDIYILRRTKDDLAKINTRLELPPCYFENVELDMFPDERQLYEFVFKDAQDTIKDAFKNAISLNSKNMVILECLLRARQCMILATDVLRWYCQAKQNTTRAVDWQRSNKMETLFRMIKSHPDEKTLVFCQFRGEMDYIQQNMECPTFRIDGSVPKEERDNQVTLFKKAPPGSVFIIQIRSGGSGTQPPRGDTRLYYGTILESRDRTPSYWSGAPNGTDKTSICEEAHLQRGSRVHLSRRGDPRSPRSQIHCVFKSPQ